ncbi:hypothetical protein [Rhodoferax sp.]|uniref:DUF7673 family protein n=1 Tax=Rhodoferax sp. TaxID=50421 RepID=UPI00274731B8|nr:hypothetical protein [Rhodoferax sp.]
MSAVVLSDIERRAARSASITSRHSAEQLAALQRLYELPKRHVGTGGGRSAARLLLGLYNGTRFPFDLTDLRSFDRTNFEAAMTVIRMDAPHCQYEVHSIIDAIYADTYYTGDEFENWAYNLKLKGRCSKDNLPPFVVRSLP